MVNDFIVINVLLDNVLPVQFLVDTGAENTVLLEKRMSDMLEVNYRRTYNIRGSDLETVLTAYLATGIDLRLADALLARDRSMLVLKENYFNFERIIGENIQGILGADFLMRFIVEIDFKKKKLILHDPSEYTPSKRHKQVRAAFVRNRPYVQLPIRFNAKEPTRRRLLLDSGAGLTLLVHTFGDSTETDIDLPVQTVPAFIASGLGGKLEGSVGRSRSLEIGGKVLSGVVTYFQPIDTAKAAYLNEREGIIGNRILRRFNVVIDYPNGKVFLRPEGRWREKFRFDRSGMTLLAGGKNLRAFNVASVIPDSPAARAGLQIGDRIVAFNGTSASFLSLSTILRKLEGKPGRRIKIRYSREGKYFATEFRLKELI